MTDTLRLTSLNILCPSLQSKKSQFFKNVFVTLHFVLNFGQRYDIDHHVRFECPIGGAVANTRNQKQKNNTDQKVKGQRFTSANSYGVYRAVIEPHAWYIYNNTISWEWISDLSEKRRSRKCVKRNVTLAMLGALL